MQMEYLPRKIRLPEDASGLQRREAAPIVVREYHLDTNGHVNNAQYVHMALTRRTEEEGHIQRLRVEYKEQAHLGDVIYPEIYEWKQADTQATAQTTFLRAEDGRCYCICEMIDGEKNA